MASVVVVLVVKAQVTRPSGLPVAAVAVAPAQR
jgi:hypothetical protein